MAAAESVCRSAFALAAATLTALSAGGAAHSKRSVARTIPHLSIGSGPARSAPLAMRPLYWPKVQQTLGLRLHLRWYDTLNLWFAADEKRVLFHICETIFTFAVTWYLETSAFLGEPTQCLVHNSAIIRAVARSPRAARNDAWQRLLGRQARARPAAQPSASSLHRH